ncbi:MAG: AfsR/SARP family transcriptional regulator [Geodermatophilaceae bacterium]
MSGDPDVGLLGPLEVGSLYGGGPVSAPKHRHVLALLLLGAGRVVSIDAFVSELWDDRPPASYPTTLQTYIYQLRRRPLFGSDGEIVTHRQGYALLIDQRRLDFVAAEEHLRAGDELAKARPEEAVTCYERALGLWRGPTLADVSCGPITSAAAVRLDQHRVTTQERRVAALLGLGQVTRAIAETKALVIRQPHNEVLHGVLMRALAARGRRYEALDRYSRFRVSLHEQLGVRPSLAMRVLHQRVLETDVVAQMSENSGGRSARSTLGALPPSSKPPTAGRRL